MNKYIAIVRLTKDAEVRYNTDGRAIAKFDVAVNRRFKREGEADADFFSCVCFGKTAESFEKLNIGKGTKLLIEGEVRNNNYTNREGQRVYGTQIVVESFEFCESKQSNSEPEPAPKRRDTSGDGFMNIPDGLEEELPW